MVTNPTNTNKMNNHLSSYLNSLNTEKTTRYDVGNPSAGLEQAQKYCGVKPFNGTPTPPLDNSTRAIHIKTNDKKPAQIRFIKRQHTITKMNDNINMDSTIAASMDDRSELTTS